MKLFLFVSFLCLSLPANSFSKPVAVDLYPTGAKISEQAGLSVEAEGMRPVARFSIPAYADKETLTVNTTPDSGMLVTSIQTELLPFKETDKIKELKTRLTGLLFQKTDLDSKLKADMVYIGFWENLGEHLPEKTESVDKLAEAMRKGVADAHNEIFKLNQALEPLNKQIDEVQQEIDKLTGQAQKQIQVSAYLNKKTADRIDLIFSYYIGNCKWQPVYTLNAHPGKSEIEFVWYADITQNTGASWDNVDLTLATAQARPQPQPPELQDWLIQPVPNFQVRKSEAAAKAMPLSAAPQEKAFETAGAPPEPERKEGFVFDIYDLGKQSIAAGETRRLDIRKNTWKADFKYLIRPYESQQAFVSAQLDASDKKNEFVKLPEGMATFLIDSAVVSSRMFSLVDEKEKLFFGADPQVGVKFDVLSKKSGEKGIFAGEKTYDWGWQVTINNLKSHEISVLMEDAYPQLRDDRIKLKEAFSGTTPEKDKNLLKWAFTVKPKTETAIEYGFFITYPDDLNLNFGGR